MTKTRARSLPAEAARRNQEQMARLAGEAGTTRGAKHVTQKELGARVGLSQTAVSDLELGKGGGHTVETWQRLGLALGRPFRMELERDRDGETADAGHLAMQELILRTGRSGGWDGSFELPGGGRGAAASSSRHSTDIALRSDRLRVLVLVECWNTIDDLGAAARSSAWKAGQAEHAAVAAARPGDPPYRLAVCWVVRSTARALPPAEPGLTWCDPAGTRLFARRVPAVAATPRGAPR